MDHAERIAGQPAGTGERVDVAWIHRWEHADAQLVASQLAVSVGVYNAVFAQCGDYLGGADAFVKEFHGNAPQEVVAAADLSDTHARR